MGAGRAPSACHVPEDFGVPPPTKGRRQPSRRPSAQGHARSARRRAGPGTNPRRDGQAEFMVLAGRIAEKELKEDPFFVRGKATAQTPRNSAAERGVNEISVGYALRGPRPLSRDGDHNPRYRVRDRQRRTATRWPGRAPSRSGLGGGIPGLNVSVSCSGRMAENPHTGRGQDRRRHGDLMSGQTFCFIENTSPRSCPSCRRAAIIAHAMVNLISAKEVGPADPHWGART